MGGSVDLLVLVCWGAGRVYRGTWPGWVDGLRFSKANQVLSLALRSQLPHKYSRLGEERVEKTDLEVLLTQGLG